MADPLKIMIDNWEKIEGIWKESGSGREAYGRTADTIPGFTDQVPYTQYLPYIEAMLAIREKDMEQVAELKQELDRVTLMLEEVSRDRDRLLDLVPNPNKIKIGKWNVTKSGKYYRGFRRLGSKMFAVFLGPELDEEKAWERIKAREAKEDFREALASSRQTA